ncbi:MAG TPA: murein L,D-transpeptidase catalytic domain family protein [Gammaproteobacteria bacterium]|jgi:hypothetical protein|nr:murein L,D-transpeptidase catalytic domain family protein [Gammaproteobacteria bacterium]
MKLRFVLLIFAFFVVVGMGPFSYFFQPGNQLANRIDLVIGSKNWIDKTVQTILAQADNLNPQVLKVGLTAYVKARKLGMDNKEVLTLVDYSKPSAERRLWVIDLKNQKVLYNTWVSHGKHSGEVNPTSFSNAPKSLKSSLGVFLTDASYIGGNGISLRIKGLEPNINDNAYNRSIVFHGANYVSPDIAKRGKIGRSWGCFAVSRDVIKPLIDTIKNNTLVVAYYPDKNWLKTSIFMR